MYKELRPASLDLALALGESSPAAWASIYANAQPLSYRRRLSLAFDRRWMLIKRWIPREGTVLDAGCGSGEWVAFLCEERFNAEGLDYSSEIIMQNWRRYPKLVWREGDLEALPYPDGSVAGIISWGAIEHRESPPAGALREFARVLAPGGTIIVTTPVDSEEQRAASRAQFPVTPDATFFQYFFTPGELSAHAAAVGLTPVDAGVLPPAALPLLAPRLYLKVRGSFVEKVLHRFVAVLTPFATRYRGMAYCVARKVAST
jgi:SAM-dependent methyltransferase